MKLYRIADTRHAIWSGTGAMLEVLVHARIGKVPKTHAWVDTIVPDDIKIERHGADALPEGWHASSVSVVRNFGDAWLSEMRTAVLLVPSVVPRAEFNTIVNSLHPDAASIAVATPRPVVWDERLFARPN